MIFVTVFFVVSEVHAPLGMGGLGTQPLKVSETFCTLGCLEPLLTQGTIMLNCGDVLLELANFCICCSDFLVIGSKVIEFSGDSPILKLSGMLQQHQELRIQSSKYCSEPTW
jgi:hypothetical protein